MINAEQAAWPEGVVARYLTIGGATADVAEQSGHFATDDPTETVATCLGCGEVERVEWGFNITAHEVGRAQDAVFSARAHDATQKVRNWAQAHAECCRAMPRP